MNTGDVADSHRMTLFTVSVYPLSLACKVASNVSLFFVTGHTIIALPNPAKPRPNSVNATPSNFKNMLKGAALYVHCRCTDKQCCKGKRFHLVRVRAYEVAHLFAACTMCTRTAEQWTRVDPR